MLGCIQPMSSPMMNMMFGFCWAAAGPAARVRPAASATRAAAAFRRCLMPRLLSGFRECSLHLLQRHVRGVHATQLPADGVALHGEPPGNARRVDELQRVARDRKSTRLNSSHLGIS